MLSTLMLQRLKKIHTRLSQSKRYITLYYVYKTKLTDMRGNRFLK